MHHHQHTCIFNDIRNNLLDRHNELVFDGHCVNNIGLSYNKRYTLYINIHYIYNILCIFYTG